MQRDVPLAPATEADVVTGLGDLFNGRLDGPNPILLRGPVEWMAIPAERASGLYMTLTATGQTFVVVVKEYVGERIFGPSTAGHAGDEARPE